MFVTRVALFFLSHKQREYREQLERFHCMKMCKLKLEGGILTQEEYVAQVFLDNICDCTVSRCRLLCLPQIRYAVAGTRYRPTVGLCGAQSRNPSQGTLLVGVHYIVGVTLLRVSFSSICPIKSPNRPRVQVRQRHRWVCSALTMS